MPARRFQIDQLIINSPYDEPREHWRYDRQDRMFDRVEGRRPAGYLVASPESQGFDDPGVFVQMPLVNQIRPRVRAWREGGYAGATGTTRRLLEHWCDPQQRDNRFFFCQLEAIETLIWLAVQHIWEAIRCENTTALEPVFDPERPIVSTGDMRPWWTGKPCEHTKRSHVNFCVFDSTWEASEAFELDRSKNVIAWVKNDHLGFEVMYVYRGAVRKYRPDFLIRLANGTMLVLEIKGQDSQENKAKRQFLAEWVDAVNARGGFGKWAWDVSFSTNDLGTILARHVGPATVPMSVNDRE